MSMQAESIENASLSLSVEDRTLLLVRLLESIEDRTKSEPAQVERAWVAEANRRYQAYLHGDEEAIPADKVFPELRADDH